MKFKRSVVFILFLALSLSAVSPVDFAFAAANAPRRSRSGSSALKRELQQTQADLTKQQKKLSQNQKEIKNARAVLAKRRISKTQRAAQLAKINKLESENKKLNSAIRRDREKIRKLEQQIAERGAKK